MQLSEISAERKRELENIASNVVSGIIPNYDNLDVIDTEELLLIMMIFSTKIEKISQDFFDSVATQRPDWLMTRDAGHQIALIKAHLEDSITDMTDGWKVKIRNARSAIRAITEEIVERTKRETEIPEENPTKA